MKFFSVFVRKHNCKDGQWSNHDVQFDKFDRRPQYERLSSVFYSSPVCASTTRIKEWEIVDKKRPWIRVEDCWYLCSGRPWIIRLMKAVVGPWSYFSSQISVWEIAICRDEKRGKGGIGYWQRLLWSSATLSWAICTCKVSRFFTGLKKTEQWWITSHIINYIEEVTRNQKSIAHHDTAQWLDINLK